MPATILVVEDEDRQRATLVRHLERAGFEVVDAPTGEAGLAAVRERGFAALVTDLRLPGIDGIELVRRAREIDVELTAIVMTAYASLETAVEALRAGAHDYILKPLFFDELTRKLTLALEHRALVRENSRLRRALQSEGGAEEWVGVSAKAQAVRDWIARAARADSTVLITGETGTGKEIVARAIHRLGARAEQPLVTINVAALPPTTIESELFGHERGAFTGAQKEREGLLRAAGSGTVFLDEIGELTPELQAKLLRALELHEIVPVGSDRTTTFDARILCATHRDLQKRVAAGEFREDLYYRLNVLQIECPPLRDHAEDLPAIAHTLCERIARRTGVEPPVIESDAMRALCAYAWPGNVRELSNVLERAMILAEGGSIEVEHLALDRGDFEAAGALDLKTAVDEFERRHVAKVLRLCDGNREQAAKALGLSIATLYRRLERLDLKGDKAKDV